MWLLVFSLLFLVGTNLRATWATPFIQTVAFFIGFLVSIVSAGSISQRDRLFGFNSGPDAGMAVVSKNLKALEAFLWINTFVALYVTVYVFYKHNQRADGEEKKTSHA